MKNNLAKLKKVYCSANEFERYFPHGSEILNFVENESRTITWDFDRAICELDSDFVYTIQFSGYETPNTEKRHIMEIEAVITPNNRVDYRVTHKSDTPST